MSSAARRTSYSRAELPAPKGKRVTPDGTVKDALRGSRLTDAVTALYHATQDKAHQKPLRADYDLTDARRQELANALAAYDTLKTSVRETIIDGKTARASLRTEFAELGTLLQDRLMRQLRKYERKAPAFYARVVAARQVVDRPGSATAGTPPVGQL